MFVAMVARGAEVKVLADRALPFQASYRILFAAIARCYDMPGMLHAWNRRRI